MRGRNWLIAMVIVWAMLPQARGERSSYRVYVSNEVSGEVSVIDAGKQVVVATVAVGNRPRGIGVSPDGSKLYVALSGSPLGGPRIEQAKLPPPDKPADGIGVIDLESLRLSDTLQAGSGPKQFAIDRVAGHLYVANEDAGQATILDLNDKRILATLEVGHGPEGVSQSPDGTVVYITSEASNQVHVIDTGTHAIRAVIATDERPRSVAFTPDSRKAYITCEDAGVICVVDVTAAKVVNRISLRPSEADHLVRPMGAVVSPDGLRAFVTTGPGRSVVVIDTQADQVIARISEVGQRPWGIAISPDGGKIYTANGPSNDVSVIDAQTLHVLRRIPCGKSPWGVAVDDLDR